MASSIGNIIAISVLTLDKIKLNDNRYGELLLQLWHWTRSNWMTISMENYYFSSDTRQDGTEWQSLWRITISVWVLDKIKLNDNHHGELLHQSWHWTRKKGMTSSMEDYCLSSNTKQGKNEWQSVYMYF